MLPRYIPIGLCPVLTLWGPGEPEEYFMYILVGGGGGFMCFRFMLHWKCQKDSMPNT